MAYTVSVPYRGTTFLNGEKWFVSKLYVGFPSPIGELHFSIRYYLAMYQEQRKMFPSPIGELHFSIDTYAEYDLIESPFPSPIGELHFSMVYILMLDAILWFPSPIGELHFSMCGLLVRSVEHGKFPSPIGELHFSIRRIKQW